MLEGEELHKALEEFEAQLEKERQEEEIKELEREMAKILGGSYGKGLGRNNS